MLHKLFHDLANVDMLFVEQKATIYPRMYDWMDPAVLCGDKRVVT